MAASPEAVPALQRGHVLWLVLVMLSLLAELAAGSLQMAASGGFMALREAERMAVHARAEAVASALQRLPLPPATAVPDVTRAMPWLAVPGADIRACGRAGQAYAGTACDGAAPDWTWRLRLISGQTAAEGTDTTAFPLLQRQHWRLDVSVRGTAWRFDYLQRLRP